jgi:hypothetical protein
MTKRTLIDNTEVIELNKPIDLILRTKAPHKWKLVDLETGEEYIGTLPEDREQSDWYWKRIKSDQIDWIDIP